MDENNSNLIDLNEIYELIFSDDFGQPEETVGFISSIKHLNPKQRIIKILNHFIELEELRNKYLIAQNLLGKHASDFLNSENENILSNKKPLHNPNDPLTYFTYSQITEDYFYKCKDFIFFYLEGELTLELDLAFTNVYLSFSIHDFERKINNKKPILLDDDSLLEISPLFFSFEQWKEIIIHDLSTPIYFEKFNSAKSKIIGLINELEYHIEGNKIPSNFNRYFEYTEFEDGTVFYDFRTSFKNFNAKNFNTPIKDYLNFIYNLNEDNILDIGKKNLIEELKKEHKKKADLLEINKRNIPFKNGKLKSITNGLAYLIHKSNPKLRKQDVEIISTDITNSFFKNTIPSELTKDSKITISNEVIVDYFIFLAKNKYITFHNKITLYPELISDRIPLKLKGFGKKRLYNIFKEKLNSSNIIISKELEDYSEVLLKFNGLTSEKVLKNEMRK